MRFVVWSTILLTAGCAGKRPAASPGPDPAPPATQPGPTADVSDDAFDALDDELAGKVAAVNDPIEPWNRAMFGLNDALYVWVARPFLPHLSLPRRLTLSGKRPGGAATRGVR